MTKNKTQQLIANVEPKLSQMVWDMVRADSTSMSKYLRGLIIEDMKSRGLLTPDMIQEML